MNDTRLAEHDTALSGLLESLLAEVPANAPVRTNCEPAPGPELNTTQEQPLPEQGAAASLIPDWAASAFRALLFRIGGIRFALPLVLMRSVVSLERSPRRLPGQPTWQVGIVHSRGRQVVLAELGGLIGIEARCRAMRYLLVIDDGGLALACDEVEEAVLVETTDVRWHRRSPDRAWLAGLLLGQMCVLLNADALAGVMRHG